MTIRYECDECGSVLKIKDELAGTEGKCPKCKNRFTVPEEKGKAPKGESSNNGDSPATGSSPSMKQSQEKRESKSTTALADETPADPAESLHAPIDNSADTADSIKTGDTTEIPQESSAAVAAELMKRRSKEKKDARKTEELEGWSEPKDEESSEYVSEVGMFALTRIVPAIAGLAVLAFATYWVAMMLYGPKRDLPELGQVSGVVTLDGQPLAGARIMFHPLRESDSKTKASTSVGTSDEQGRYRLNYVEGVAGAAVGRHIVEIHAPDGQGGDRLPSRYRDIGDMQNALTLEVEPGRNTLDLELTSNP